MYVYVYVHNVIYTCIYIKIFLHTYQVNARWTLYIYYIFHTYFYIFLYIRLYIYIYTYTHTHTYIHTYTYIFVYMYTYIYIYMLGGGRSGVFDVLHEPDRKRGGCSSSAHSLQTLPWARGNYRCISILYIRGTIYTYTYILNILMCITYICI